MFSLDSDRIRRHRLSLSGRKCNAIQDSEAWFGRNPRSSDLAGQESLWVAVPDHADDVDPLAHCLGDYSIISPSVSTGEWVAGRDGPVFPISSQLSTADLWAG